jgi:hypothetical protein
MWLILRILKYVFWALTLVLAFVGEWFVSFTEDSGNGRKILTEW